ncbi:MAG: methionine biosynthesis protein MetW, partial [Burkholderiales bacterium]|nr:methionine biosynthesis protein MetW [Burkholderiales bacterium]
MNDELKKTNASEETVRSDFSLIASWVAPGARVLDLGCGDGSLLAYLRRTRQATGYGIEISIEGVKASIANRVNVLQRDLESGLADFTDGSFDCV